MLPDGAVTLVDSGVYGAVFINEPVTIDGHGHSTQAAVFGPGVVINAPGERVALRDVRTTAPTRATSASR